MMNAICRSTYGYLIALGVFALLPEMDAKISLLILTVAFVPSWYCYDMAENYLKMRGKR